MFYFLLLSLSVCANLKQDNSAKLLLEYLEIDHKRNNMSLFVYNHSEVSQILQFSSSNKILETHISQQK